MKKLWVGVLLAALMAPTFASAQTASDLQLQIQQIQGQIQALQSQLSQLQTQLSAVNAQTAVTASNATTGTILALNISHSLQLGANGDDVKALQTFLKNYPDVYPSGQITGYFGPLTQVAVKNLQAKYGIESVGIVGPKTISKINELVTQGAGNSGNIPPGLLKKITTTTISTSTTFVATTTVSNTTTTTSNTTTTGSNSGTTVAATTQFTATVTATVTGTCSNGIIVTASDTGTATSNISQTDAQQKAQAAAQALAQARVSLNCNSYNTSNSTTTTNTTSTTTTTATSTTTSSDTTPPSAPVLTATTISSIQVNLSWSSSTDNVGVAGFKIYRNGAFLTNVSNTVYSYLDNGLPANTTYNYTIYAYDAAGNTSIQSNQASATTQQSSSQIAQSLLTSGHDSADKNIYVTSPISPNANTLVTIAISENDPNAIYTRVSSVSGGGIPSWDNIGTEDVASNGASSPQRFYIYRGMVSSASSGSVTITFTGQVKNAQWIVSQWSGVDTSGTNGSGAIITTMSTARNGTTDTSGWNMGTLPVFSNPNDVNYSVFGVYSNSVSFSPGSGFTKISEEFSGENSNPSYLETQWTTNNVNISASWGVPLNVGAEMIKIKAGTSPSLKTDSNTKLASLLNSLQALIVELTTTLQNR